MLHYWTASYDNVSVKPLEEQELELLRTWRNNSSNSAYIRQLNYITPEMQKNWFETYIKDNDNMTVAIYETKTLHRCVGSVALYNFRDEIAECGKFMIGDPEARGKGVGRLGITLCMYLGFFKMGLTAIDAVVHQDNIAALTTDQKAGFSIVGEHLLPGGDGKVMEKELYVTKEQFMERHCFLPDVSIED